MHLRFITVGGTIDKVYFDQLSQYQVGVPGVARILEELPLGFAYQIESIMRKDSLDMTDADRLVVRAAVERSPEDRIVITHGTDTMIETARQLRGISGKRIVLTGAMVPYAFGSSDGLFNLGSALSFVQVLSPGVYVAMNGTHLEWDQVRKNKQLGIFEKLEQQ